MPQWYNCPGCGRVIKREANTCPCCKCYLSWSNQGPTLFVPSIDAPQQPNSATKSTALTDKIQLANRIDSLSKKQKIALISVCLSIFAVLGYAIADTTLNKSGYTQVPPNRNASTSTYTQPKYTSPKYTPPAYTPSSNYATNDGLPLALPSSEDDLALPDNTPYAPAADSPTYSPPTYTSSFSSSDDEITPYSTSTYTPSGGSSYNSGNPGAGTTYYNFNKYGGSSYNSGNPGAGTTYYDFNKYGGSSYNSSNPGAGTTYYNFNP